jgi:cell division protein FtsX
MQKTLTYWMGRLFAWGISVLSVAVTVFIIGFTLRVLYESFMYAWTFGGLL